AVGDPYDEGDDGAGLELPGDAFDVADGADLLAVQPEQDQARHDAGPRGRTQARDLADDDTFAAPRPRGAPLLRRGLDAEAEDLLDDRPGLPLRDPLALDLEFAELDRHVPALAVPDDREADPLAGGAPGQRRRELRRIADRIAVQGDDHVADPEPGAFGGRPRLDRDDVGAGDLVESVDLGVHGAHVSDQYAELRAPHDAVLDQVAGHLPRQVDGDREAVPGVVPGSGGDRRVHADDAAGQVDERAARVAGVDRRVRLDEGLERGLGLPSQDPDRAALRADDPGRDGEVQPERVPERENPIPDLEPVGVPEPDGRQTLAPRRRDL